MPDTRWLVRRPLGAGPAGKAQDTKNPGLLYRVFGIV